MSDTKTLVDAIANDDYSEAENAFYSTMVDKVTAALDSKRIEVASNMFRSEYDEPVEADVEIEDSVETEEEVTAEPEEETQE